MKKIMYAIQFLLLVVFLVGCTNQGPKPIDGPEDLDTIEEKVAWWV